MFKRLLFTCFILCIAVGQLYGQEAYILKIGAQKKISPNFKFNDETFEHTNAEGIHLALYNFEYVPVSVEFYFSKGYDSSIDFSYGTRLSYVFFSESCHWLKAGFSGGRFKMGDPERGREVGEIREDEFHENFKPFVEWNWNFSKYISLFANTGYRFLRSNTGTVKEVNERYENGDPKRIRVSNDGGVYGSGFEFGIGFDITLHRTNVPITAD